MRRDAVLRRSKYSMVASKAADRVASGACVRPELGSQARKLYSFAEAVDTNNQALKPPLRPLSWGGETMLCTRAGKFELLDQKDCTLKGLNAAGFALIDLSAGRSGTTVRFK